jgi:hypothetical protein
MWRKYEELYRLQARGVLAGGYDRPQWRLTHQSNRGEANVAERASRPRWWLHRETVKRIFLEREKRKWCKVPKMVVVVETVSFWCENKMPIYYFKLQCK